MYIDLHAHSQRTNSFIYGNVDSTNDSSRQLLLPYLIADLCDDFSIAYTQFNMDIDKAGTSRRYVFEYTVELG